MNNDSNRSNDEFNFDYAIPLDNDIYQNVMMSNATLFDTTAAIPDNLFEFITNENPAGFDPAPAPVDAQSNGQPEQSNGDCAIAGKKRTHEETEQEPAYEPPNQAMFAIIVGGKPFRLSWESIKSDGPKNFFTEFFRKRKTTRIMHVDRDPETFAAVVHHLRGYHIRPRDDLQNQSLLSDASYYGLKRLWSFLQEFFFVNVGGRSFRLCWSLFNKDKGQLNFFTGPVKDHLAIPNGNGIQTPPYYIDRDPDIFMDIITYLRGYTIRIRDEVHHKNLLKDASYYALKGLRAQLLTSRHILDGSEPSNREILLHLQSVRPANLVLSGKEVQYKHENTARELLVQVSHFDIVNVSSILRLPAELSEPDKRKLRELGNKLMVCGVDDTHVIVDEACAMTVDDRQIRHLDKLDEWEYPVKKLTVQRAIAKVQVEDGSVVLYLLRLEALSSKLQLNMKREFLSG